MRILQVISSLGNGGAEKFVVELSNELSSNHEIHVCSLKKVEDWMIFPKQLNSLINLISLNKAKGFSIGVYFRVLKLFRRIKPDVVHFHLDSTIKYIVPFVLFYPKVKFVHTIHSNLTDEKIVVFGKLNKLYFFVNRIKFVCISESIQLEFQKKYPKIKFNLIPNGIKKPSLTNQDNVVLKEFNAYKKNNETKVFISIGRIDENKNQKLQVEAFRKLENENCILLIIGNDPTPDKALMNKLTLNKPTNVYFKGFVNNIADYISACDACLFTSFNEGLPITSLEVLSYGKPIITSYVGGMKDVVENKVNGLIFYTFDSSELYSVLMDFSKLSPDSLQIIKKNNLEKFEKKYSIEFCSHSYSNLYLR